MPPVVRFSPKPTNSTLKSIIHVKDESVAQALRECADFNPNAKIIVG